MKQHHTITHLLIIVLIVLTGCKKEEIMIDPKEAILGKWELSHFGSNPVKEPVGYVEYLSDSLRISYFYNEELPITSKYWLNDSLLFISTAYSIVGEDDTYTSTWSYKYEFISLNILQLDLQKIFASETRSTLKRIK